MKSGFLIIGLVLLLAFSGCVKQDVSNEASQLPEIRAVLDEHPNAYIVTLFMRKDVIDLIIDDIREACPGLEQASYWYVTLNVGPNVWEFYVDEQVSRVVCAIYPEELPLNECSNYLECDDFDASTKNECKGSPMKCVYTRIAECVNGDGFCPAGCDYANDSDCPAVDTCQADADCNDYNSLTADACIGTPKHCMHSLAECGKIGGFLCTATEACNVASLPSSSAGVCCSAPCVRSKSCEGVVCKDWQKCVNGLCYAKSCKERELPLCTVHEECIGQPYIDDFGVYCCEGACQLPCASDANCDSEEVCRGGFCMPISCKDIGGRSCDPLTEWCSGDLERTVDNENCCIGCSLKKCVNMDGAICRSYYEKCAGEIKQAYDTNTCCLAICEELWCSTHTCTINYKCVEEDDKCVLKSCNEMKGIRCGVSFICNGFFYNTTDGNCCAGTCFQST